MKNYTPEQIMAIVNFANDFVTWVNTQLTDATKQLVAESFGELLK